MTQTKNCNKGEPIEVKRLYLPIKMVVFTKCCYANTYVDLSKDPLSEPKVGEPVMFSVMCPECEKFNLMPLTLNVSVTIDEDSATVED
jgi:hypothetical protein